VNEQEKLEDEARALFVSDEELRRRTNPKIGRDRFRAMIKDLEVRKGFPPANKTWGGRYWPKVVQWLDSDNNISSAPTPHGSEDGPEFFHEAPRLKRRPIR